MSKNDVNNLRVIVGDQDIKNSFDVMSAKTYTVKRVVRHKNFDINSLFHDVAVLSLSQDINFDHSVQSVCLNRQSNHDFTGTTVQVAGWGATSAGSATSSTLRRSLSWLVEEKPWFMLWETPYLLPRRLPVVRLGSISPV